VPVFKKFPAGYRAAKVWLGPNGFARGRGLTSYQLYHCRSVVAIARCTSIRAETNLFLMDGMHQAIAYSVDCSFLRVIPIATRENHLNAMKSDIVRSCRFSDQSISK